MTEQVTTIAKGVSDFGFLVMASAFFLLLSATMMISYFKWFKNIINGMIQASDQRIGSLLDETQKQNEKLEDIAESLRPETKTRINIINGMMFELCIEKACRLIKRIREQNHIKDREKTLKKIHDLATIMYEESRAKFDSFTFRGQPLSEYTNPAWVDWVAQVIESEIYHVDGANNNRAFTNVSAVFDRVKLDFYQRLNKAQ